MMSPEHEGTINRHIMFWSMRPQPGTPTGTAWEQGCRQGYEWGLQDALPEPSQSSEESKPVAWEETRAQVIEECINQYYYRVSECKAPNNGAVECVCWHEEGSGPLPSAKREVDSHLTWRYARQLKGQAAERVAPVREGMVSVSSQLIAGLFASYCMEEEAVKRANGASWPRDRTETWVCALAEAAGIQVAHRTFEQYEEMLSAAAVRGAAQEGSTPRIDIGTGDA